MSAYRRQGIGAAMVRQLMARAPGQHIGLQTDDAEAFYTSLGYQHQPVFMATDLYRPITAGPPPGLTTSPMTAATRAASSASCPGRSPVIASSRNGFSLGYPACVTARDSREKPF